MPSSGSVNGANCKELATQPDVDGFLVGGASLKVVVFSLFLVSVVCLVSLQPGTDFLMYVFFD